MPTQVTLIHLWPFPSEEPTHPDEQLSDDHIGHCAGEVQSGAPVSVPVGLVNLLLGAMCQQHHHQPQVVLHHCAKQLLPQGHIRLGQSHKEQLLLVLGSDPTLFFLPGEKEMTGMLKSGRVEHVEQTMGDFAPLQVKELSMCCSSFRGGYLKTKLRVEVTMQRHKGSITAVIGLRDLLM